MKVGAAILNSFSTYNTLTAYTYKLTTIICGVQPTNALTMAMKVVFVTCRLLISLLRIHSHLGLWPLSSCIHISQITCAHVTIITCVYVCTYETVRG